MHLQYRLSKQIQNAFDEMFSSSIESVEEIIFAKVLIVTFDLTSLIINLKLQNNREKI